MAHSAKLAAQIASKNSALFLCDMQVKFRPTVKYFDEIVSVSNRLLKTSMALKIPTIVTEQYPAGLGPTVPELGIEEFNLKAIDKTQFCMIVPEVQEKLRSLPEVKHIILCGIETQACIQQTAFALLEQNYIVHLIVDACSSRSLVDRKYAFKLMRDCGAFLTTSESMVLSLLRNSAHPKFKEIQKFIATSAPDTGLL